MRMYDIIDKKKKGKELTKEEISFFVSGVCQNTIPDYQITALLMAICFRGMTDEETTCLTYYMANSGNTVDLSLFKDLSVDKHSTGGVGDKTTLIVAPIVAASGLKVAKMSGRGLGFTGGTIDKLESIKGYNVNLTSKEFLRQVEDIGVSVVSQSGNLTPADKKIYSLRDSTATVDSIPLIASSVMSKKLAAGSKNIVLDVKMGSGAFVKNLDDAVLLAEKMVNIGKNCNRNTAAVISNMNQPLGYAIGNSLEVIEAINTLKEPKKNDLTEICLSLSAIMLSLSFGISENEARKKAEESLYSKKAFSTFKEWIKAQGGEEAFIDDTELFPKAKYSLNVTTENDGYISFMDCEKIGIAASTLGAGRTQKDSELDYAAGVVVCKKTGEFVKVGEPLATLYTNDESFLKDAEKLYKDAVCITDIKPEHTPLILKIIR